jgi:hypothetical protein
VGIGPDGDVAERRLQVHAWCEQVEPVSDGRTIVTHTKIAFYHADVVAGKAQRPVPI